MRKLLWFIVPLLFALAWLVGRWLQPDLHLADDRDEQVLAALWCEPQMGDCIFALPQTGQVLLTISPHDAILPMRPLQATVEMSSQWQIESMVIVGVNMEMGINQFDMALQAPGYWQGDFILPLCAVSRMEWELRLFLVNATDRLIVPFRFVTQN